MYGIHALVKSMFAGQGLTHVAASAAPTPTGGVIPTAPGPGDVFREGGACTFSWTPDPSGVWKHTDVELMTGDNLNMVFLTTVVTFDGTDPSLTTFSYPCPDVEPNSAIYFYQFSSDAAPGALMWTARFAIADAQGKVTPPPNATQPDGQKIPWGTGALADPAKAVPEPAYLLPGAASAPSSASASATDSATSTEANSRSLSSTVTPASSRTSSDSATDITSTSSSSSSAASSRVATVTRTASAGQTTPTDVSEAGGNGSDSGSGGIGTGTGNRASRLGISRRQAALGLGLTAAVFAIAS